jgi:hypothetical protein
VKWITAFSILVALLAVAALALVFKIGVALPPNLEDMTIEGNGLLVTNANLHVSISNQTHGEISVTAVLDGSVQFGASLIRDEHFGDCGLNAHAAPGTHSLALMIAGRPPAINTFNFSTTSVGTNFIFISIWGDRHAGYRFNMKQSDHPFGIM